MFEGSGVVKGESFSSDELKKFLKVFSKGTEPIFKGIRMTWDSLTPIISKTN